MIILTQMNLCLSSLSLKTPRLKGKVETNIQVKKCQKANFFLPWLAHRCKLGSYSWNWSRGGHFISCKTIPDYHVRDGWHKSELHTPIMFVQCVARLQLRRVAEPKAASTE